jgi:Cu/Ag efflux protein CusF
MKNPVGYVKKIAGAVAAVLITAGLALAQETPGSGQYSGTGSQQADKAKDKTELSADVVSIDKQAKTITVKKTDTTGMAAPEQMTLTVDASAQSALNSLTAGDRVKLEYKTDSAGTQRVTKITRAPDTRPATGEPPSTQPPPQP